MLNGAVFLNSPLQVKIKDFILKCCYNKFNKFWYGLKILRPYSGPNMDRFAETAGNY